MEDKAKQILAILNGIVAISKLDVTLGLSEEMANPCVCVIKDKKLVDKIDRDLGIILMIDKKNLTEGNLTLAELFSCLGIVMETPVLISHLDNLDHDMLILFKDPDLVNSIFYENKKKGVL